MKKIINILILVFISSVLSGCSLLKIATAPLQTVKNAIPQQVETNVKKMKCSGDIKVLQNGDIYCSDGFYLYESNSSKKERKLSWREKIGQFITHATGYIFWAVIFSIILTVMGLGALVNSFWSATFSVGSKAFRQVVSAIQKSKDSSPDLIKALESSTDEDVRKFITEYKLKNNIK
jgi:hypothetical protein